MKKTNTTPAPETTNAPATLADITRNSIQTFVDSVNALELDNSYTLAGGKEITSTELKRSYVTTASLLASAEISSIALVCELAKVTKKVAEKDGFKTVMDYLRNAFGARLDTNTLSRYYRVGRIFASRSDLKWRDGIPASVSITNLGQVLALIDIKWTDLDSMDEPTLSKIFDKFYADYIETEKLHLNALNKVLRDEIKDIKNPAIIEATAEEVTSDTSTSDTSNTSADTVKVDEDAERASTARDSIDYLYQYFRGNDKALEALAVLLAEIPATE